MILQYYKKELKNYKETNSHKKTVSFYTRRFFLYAYINYIALLPAKAIPATIAPIKTKRYNEITTIAVIPVSYTHLDVYKRQIQTRKRFGSISYKRTNAFRFDN